MEVRFQLGGIKFTWDLRKQGRNILVHGVTFEEAATTWLDPNGLERFDEQHSLKSWLRIGLSIRGALLVTWSTERLRRGDNLVRIIGARRATGNERRLHEEGNP